MISKVLTIELLHALFRDLNHIKRRKVEVQKNNVSIALSWET